MRKTQNEEQTQAPATVDPVKRYLAYQKAWLDGELDSAFNDGAWLRFVHSLTRDGTTKRVVYV